jgi:hypothetical protein
MLLEDFCADGGILSLLWDVPAAVVKLIAHSSLLLTQKKGAAALPRLPY